MHAHFCSSVTRALCCLSLVWLALSSVFGQGAFQNLNFEAAHNLPAPSPGNLTYAPISNALPDWAGYVGTNIQSQVVYDVTYNALAGLALATSNTVSYYGYTYHVQGGYAAVLMAGVDPAGSGSFVSAAVSQYGRIPATANSVLFAVDAYEGPGDLIVSFNGQSLPLVHVGNVSPYLDQWGCDVSGLSGQTGELRFTELPTFYPRPPYQTLLDDIIFSSELVPEPGAWGLLGVAGLVLALKFVLPSSRKSKLL